MSDKEQPEERGGPIPPPIPGMGIEETIRLLYGYPPSVTAFTVSRCDVHGCTMLDGECAVCKSEAEEADTETLVFESCPDCDRMCLGGYCPYCNGDIDDPISDVIDRDSEDDDELFVY